VINSNVGLILHRLATLHPLQTNRKQTHRAKDALQHGYSASNRVNFF